ncbi:hypothetical protein JAK58_07260 [Stenotrophomonas maltophilia]|uniref:hypothetical protein n=1 Tax=Stenotrophomonas maltophilia TaxID=40324 RepID=UPI0021C89A7E|nr:hypothetical protein [Stenotrophomonas maltophilia]MCU1091315.1 hypothetical protein [Stenotrophomonas maltophilia]
MKVLWCWLFAAAAWVPLSFVAPKLALPVLWALVVVSPLALFLGIRSASADDVEDAE